MDVRVNDKIEMKKAHPCQNKIFTVTRVGMDFKIRCDKCGHEIMIPRSKVEKILRR